MSRTDGKGTDMRSRAARIMDRVMLRESSFQGQLRLEQQHEEKRRARQEHEERVVEQQRARAAWLEETRQKAITAAADGWRYMTYDQGYYNNRGDGTGYYVSTGSEEVASIIAKHPDLKVWTVSDYDTVCILRECGVSEMPWQEAKEVADQIDPPTRDYGYGRSSRPLPEKVPERARETQIQSIPRHSAAPGGIWL